MFLLHELILAFCLFLVIEGIIPFLYPNKWRALARKLETLSDQTLRLSGLFSMLLGVALLYLLR